MRKRLLTGRNGTFLMIVLAAVAGALADITFLERDTVDLQRSARKIMLDGFLLEWNIETARPWGSDTAWQWNAMTTPEGPAGYLTVSEEVAARGWKIFFDGPMFHEMLIVNLPSDTSLKSGPVRVDITGSDSGGVYIVEWLFPFPVQASGMPNPVTVTFRAEAAGGAQLPAVVVRSGTTLKRNSVWGGVTGKGILIGVLALLYFFVQRQLKRQTGRKESPRQ